MKVQVQVLVAATLWLALLVPLWYTTILVNRADLNFDELSRYELLSQGELLAYIPIALYGESHPDAAAAAEHVLNKKLESMGSDRRFIVSGECTEDAELCLRVKLGNVDSFGLDSSSSELEIEVSQQCLTSGALLELVTLLLFDHVYKDELSPNTLPAHDEVTISYSPKYHLTFSLLGEEGALLDWQIAEALQKYMDPLLSQIDSTIANVTLDTQTGLYAKLGCPRTVQIPQSSLATFVDFAEWSLASSTSYPTLNFVYYVPTSPLEIGEERTNSFIIPQWGGVMIAEPQLHNHSYTAAELEPVIQKFATQLLAILGMREPQNLAPASKACPSVRMGKLSRLVTIKGIRNAASSLGSLKRLAESMPLIAIPTQVSVRARTAALEINEAIRALHEGNTEKAAGYASKAFENADKAFFDKHMVAQAHFPDEQKLAVYMPLIGPLSIVVLSGWLRIYKKWKTAKPRKNEVGEKQEASKTDAPKS